MNKLDYYFFISEDENGRKVPAIHINNSNYEMLGNLSQGHLSNSKGVKKEINQIKKVLAGQITNYSFGGDDWCILNLHKDKTLIVNGFDEFEPIEISTKQILSMMIDWYHFLMSNDK